MDWSMNAPYLTFCWCVLVLPHFSPMFLEPLFVISFISLNLSNCLLNSPGTLIPPSPSISCFLLPTLALLSLMTSLSTTSAMMCFGMAPTNLLFSQCLDPFVLQMLSSRSNWRIIKSSHLLSNPLLVIPGTNLKSFWVICLVLVRCWDRLSMAIS